jgi:hypothetical protein
MRKISYSFLSVCVPCRVYCTKLIRIPCFMIEKLVFLLLTDSQVITLFILLFTAFQDPPNYTYSLHYYTVLYIIRIRTKIIYIGQWHAICTSTYRLQIHTPNEKWGGRNLISVKASTRFLLMFFSRRNIFPPGPPGSCLHSQLTFYTNWI